MAGAIDRATLDRLIALGRERGELTASELQAALPVEALDVDALVLLMLELEDAGVSVEPDAFGPRTDAVVPPGLALATPDPSVPQDARPTGQGDATAAGATAPRSITGPRGDEGADAEADAGRAVLLAGAAVLLVLGTILILI